MELTDAHKVLFRAAAAALTGSVRRVFMARTVAELGPGGQRRAERELGWDRETIRKGTHEWRRGIAIADAFALRGRKPAEVQLPNLLTDLAAIAASQSQTRPVWSCRQRRRRSRPTSWG